MSQDQAEQFTHKILDKSGIKTRLSFASLYITTFEILKNLVVEEIKSFYSLGRHAKDSTAIPSESYDTEVLSLFKKPNGKKNPLRASLIWLKEADAIDARDEADFFDIEMHRNDIVHELGKYIVDEDHEINMGYMVRMMEILRKIEIWWIVNVDIPSNEKYDGVEINEDSITPGRTLLLSYLYDAVFEDYISPK